MVRIGGRVIKIARFTSRKASQCESDLHKAFDLVRFEQTRTRRYFKLVCQVFYLWLVYYGVTNYQLTTENLQTAYIGSAAMFFVLFHAEIKIGISNNTSRREKEVNDDLSSGYTEWFAIPWPFVFFVPLVTWFRVAPAKASISLALYGSIILLIVKNYLMN